jgi:uncharacterized phage protein (TIGR02220 family)
MGKFEILRKLLMSSGSIVVNKELALALGLETAIMYSELLSKAEYFKDNLNNEGMFFNTIEDMQKSTTLSAYQQRLAINKLEKYNLINCKLKGLPATRYFWINEDCDLLINLLNNKKLNISQLALKISQQEVKKVDGNNTNFNNIKDNNTNNNGYSPLYKEIIEYLNTKADTGYRHTTKETQKLIRARLNEGFTVDDFKKVIDINTKKWKDKKTNNGVEMGDYLRPITLFGTKFESYLNQKVKSYSKFSPEDFK